MISPAFAVAEALWVLSGSGEAWIHEFNSSLAAFIGDGPPHGAYGPRLRAWAGIDQFERVRRLLLDDPDTRRAVLTIFDPARDLADARDIPCTLGHRLYLRDGSLHTVTSMRSQDVWRGLPYDLFTATLMLELMAGSVGADVGHWHHEAARCTCTRPNTTPPGRQCSCTGGRDADGTAGRAVGVLRRPPHPGDRRTAAGGCGVG